MRRVATNHPLGILQAAGTDPSFAVTLPWWPPYPWKERKGVNAERRERLPYLRELGFQHLLCMRGYPFLYLILFARPLGGKILSPFRRRVLAFFCTTPTRS